MLYTFEPLQFSVYFIREMIDMYTFISNILSKQNGRIPSRVNLVLPGLSLWCLLSNLHERKTWRRSYQDQMAPKETNRFTNIRHTSKFSRRETKIRWTAFYFGAVKLAYRVLIAITQNVQASVICLIPKQNFIINMFILAVTLLSCLMFESNLALIYVNDGTKFVL